MKVFGLWERLTRIKFFDGKELTIEPATQDTEDKVITIPNVSPATTQEIVLTEQTQTLKNKTISGADNTFQDIPGAALNAGSVTADKLDPATVGGAGLQIVDNGGTDNLAVKPDNISIEIASDAVQIKDAGVNTPKIADNAVTTAKIADQNVTTAKIADANVTTTKIADANVTTAKILDANVTTAKIADSAITTEKIADNEVTNAKLETAVAVDGTGITLDKFRIEDGLGSNPDGRGKVLKRDTITGAVVNGNQIPTTGEVLTDTVAQTALLKTLDRLQTQLVSVSMTSSTVSHGSRVGVIEVTESDTGSITGISVQNDNGAHLVIVNKTAAPILIDNEAAEAGLQILTGTGGPINLASNGSLFLVYRTDKWHVIGGTGGGAGGTVTQVTTPVAHGFTAADKGKALYLNGSVYTPAIATAANTAEIVGILAGVIDSDTFELATGGAVESISGDDFEGGSVPAKGTVIFLSASEAGKYTSTEPTVIGQISKPIGIIFEANKLFMYNMRGSVIGSANARTAITLVNGSTTTIQNVTNYEAGELAGYVHLDTAAGTDYRFYVQAQFAKNGAGTDWNLSYQTTGDTPPAGFSLSVTAAGEIRCTLPTITGLSLGRIIFALNAPAVGTSFPLQVDSSSVSFDTIQAKSVGGISVKNAAGSATNLFVSDAGNVGIGTSSPTEKLLVSGNIRGDIVYGNRSSAGAVTDGGLAVSIDGALQAGIYSPASGTMSFQTGGTERARIDASGQIFTGGATAPVFGGASVGKLYVVSAGVPMQMRCTLSTAGKGWNVGPASGNEFVVYNQNSTGMYMADGATSWRANSDERLKKNIKPLEYGLAEIVALKPVRFDYKTEESEESARIGFIAQEVLPVVKEAVSGSEETKYGVGATELIPVLVAAIKEQQAQIESLRAEVEALKGRS